MSQVSEHANMTRLTKDRRCATCDGWIFEGQAAYLDARLDEVTHLDAIKCHINKGDYSDTERNWDHFEDDPMKQMGKPHYALNEYDEDEPWSGRSW